MNKGQHHLRNSVLVVLAQGAPSPRQRGDGNGDWKEPVFCFEDVYFEGQAVADFFFLASQRGTAATLPGAAP